MARRISRRPKVVWLPSDINNRLGLGVPATVGTQTALGAFDVDLSPGASTGVTSTVTIPIVKDEPQNITGATETLSDLEGSAYRLRRICGKIFVRADNSSAVVAVGSVTTFLVTAGFIILRTLPSGAPLSALSTDYETTSLDNVRDPWIWRRNWIVANNIGILTANPTSLFVGSAPTSNYTLGSGGVLDGPHVDAKTARVVSDEERLFLVVSSTALDGDAQTGVTQDSVHITYDLRVLASMRSSSGNRRNASR